MGSPLRIDAYLSAFLIWYRMVGGVDTYDETAAFSAVYPLVAAFPAPRAIRAVVAGNFTFDVQVDAVRRRDTSRPWSFDNVEPVAVPREIIEPHAAEVRDILAQPPLRARIVVRRYALAPHDEYRVASFGVMRKRVDVEPVSWARSVAENVDEPSMILLAEQLHDTFPWVPMILFAEMLRELDPKDLWLRAAEHRLRLAARRLLDAQGLVDVRVDDTLCAKPAVQRGLFSVLQK